MLTDGGLDELTESSIEGKEDEEAESRMSRVDINELCRVVLSCTDIEKIERDSKLAQQIKALLTKSDGVQFLGPTWWRERPGSHRLSSDLHTRYGTYTHVVNKWAGKMAQWLRMLTALAEDAPEAPVPGDRMHSSAFPGLLHVYGAHTYTQPPPIYVNNKSLKKENNYM